MMGLDALGAEELETRQHNAVAKSVLSLFVGAICSQVFHKHPVLAFIGGAAVAGNLYAVAQKERAPKKAVRNMGKHAVAIAGSLALSNHPVWGYIAGAVAGNLIIDSDEGDGILDRLMPDDKTTALVKQ